METVLWYILPLQVASNPVGVCCAGRKLRLAGSAKNVAERLNIEMHRAGL